MEKQLIDYLIPQELTTYFDVEKIVETPLPGTQRFQLHIHLKEKNILPGGYDSGQWESKGFTPPKTIQDFPIRGKMVFLVLQCRRWRHKDDPNKIIRRDLSFLADGAKMTADLSAFLKDTRGGA